jgi:hypothetical protein
MICSAFDYVDAVIEHLCAMADEVGLSDVRRHVDGLCEVGARIRCAQAVDGILARDLASAHSAGESGQDIEKRHVPQWRTVAANEYDGQQEGLTYGAQDTQRRKAEAGSRGQKRSGQRRH